MKNIIYVLSFLFILSGISCSNSDSKDKKATVNINVTNDLLQIPVNVPVYMFKNQVISSDSDPDDADMMVLTDEGGVARFHINLSDHNISEGYTRLYFAVIMNIDNIQHIQGTEGITVRDDDEKRVVLEIEWTLPDEYVKDDNRQI